jgi:dienelactone hydrolase
MNMKTKLFSKGLHLAIQKVQGTALVLTLVSTLTLSYMNSFSAPKPAPSFKEVNITYKVDGVTLNGYIVYDQNKIGKRPAVLVVPEWWGMNDYTKMRAKMLAELGYIAMTVDMYGNGKIAADPKEALELATPFYKDPASAKRRLEAAIGKIKEFQQCDAGNMAAIGYCFGGSMVLNSAKLGINLKGVVSFHGGLAGVPANKELLKAKILVCHGGSDKFVPQKDIDAFRQQLDSIGATYSFKTYANATHAFTNPNATRVGKEFNMPIEYNADADRNSWSDMVLFFEELFKK